MNFGYCILHVDDVEATLTFYQRAFGLSRKMIHENQYGELDTGDTTLAFAARSFAASHFNLALQAGGIQQAPPPMELALVTSDVPAAYAQALSAGAAAVEPPSQKPWGQVVAYVRDNNGFLVELCTPVG